ncbi:MAG TPA: siphovirus Gp157 family protein [Chitinophagaceae bacterium]|nr:siphovirus Gp157 family protein [Chitinophagaceae bacterium]
MELLQPAKTLYNIRQDHLTLLALIEENEGELTPDIEQQLVLTEEEFQDKAVSYAYVIKAFENTGDVIDAEIKRLSALKEKAVKRRELFKQTLSDAMQQFGIEKIEHPFVKLSFRKSEVVDIVDETKIPEDYMEYKIVGTISKTKIKEAIKEGVNVPGASIKEKKNLQIK